MIEAKVIQKIRELLIADTTVKAQVKDRVYSSHISSVSSPVYPAISITMLPGQARTNVPAMVNMLIQIDLWFPFDQYTIDDVMDCYDAIRTLLHRQNLTDNTIGIQVNQIIESGVGPVIPDPDANCYHFPARYAVVAI